MRFVIVPTFFSLRLQIDWTKYVSDVLYYEERQECALTGAFPPEEE